MKLDSKALCKVALESLGTLERWELSSYLEYVFIYAAPVCVPLLWSECLNPLRNSYIEILMQFDGDGIR